MNYDATNIPSNYDQGRSHGPEILALWMNTVASHVHGHNVKTILDLGCGTGRFSEALAERFGADVIGIDPSSKMLEQARRKQTDHRVRYETGRAERIPLPDKSVDLIFISMVFHHFDDPNLAARECRRVLRDGETLFLRAGTREQIPNYPYVEFFPESIPILEVSLTTRESIMHTFEAARFHTGAVELINQTIAPDLERYADKLAAGSDSVLAKLSKDEFESGLKRLCSSAATTPAKPIVEPIDVFVFR